jgi:prevent-host-death family protein
MLADTDERMDWLRMAHARGRYLGMDTELLDVAEARKILPFMDDRFFPRAARSGRWQLQDAKARFSELVRRAKQDGPQHVTVHGREEVVVVGADHFRRLAGVQTGQALVDAMQRSPHRSTSLEAARLPMPVRPVDL